jgi:phage baseplate assembly protein W
MAKNFSIEDGNLYNAPITTSIKRINKDIDTSFTAKPSTGDIYKVTDAAAVKQSVKNLLMTERGKTPFRPYYGGGLETFLFSLSTDLEPSDIENRVRQTIEAHEPRAKLVDVKVTIKEDYNTANVVIVFDVIGSTKRVTLGLTIARTR